MNMKGSEQGTRPWPNLKDAIRAPLLRVLHLVSLSRATFNRLCKSYVRQNTEKFMCKCAKRDP